MKRCVLLRPQIPDDLHAIVDYLDRVSSDVADRFLASVFAAFDDLAAFPGKGSPKRALRSSIGNLRSWLVPGFRNYLILYQTTDGAIVIWAVVHGARDLRRVLQDRTP